jgi:hypothetical protein
MPLDGNLIHEFGTKYLKRVVKVQDFDCCKMSVKSAVRLMRTFSVNMWGSTVYSDACERRYLVFVLAFCG